MRYEDWDILLFERDCKIPLREFKVSCHVLPDTEFSRSHGSYGVPTVCCFIPSLPIGAPFQVSIHSWSIPAISKFTQAYSRHTEDVTFEARLFIDGRLVASASLEQMGTWPHVISNTFEFSKNGELEPLRFPTFRQELLQQSHWCPADHVGRIMVLISEGFPRESLTAPIERVKNVIGFSFQHAPLGVLEASAIAWPNPFMWSQLPFAATMPVPTQRSGDAELHAHSPRRRGSGIQGIPSGYPIQPLQGMMTSNPIKSNTQPSGLANNNRATQLAKDGPDPFGEANAYFDWLGGIGMGMGLTEASSSTGRLPGLHSHAGRKSSTDISMPDYVSSANGGSNHFDNEQQQFMPDFLKHDSNIGQWKAPNSTPATTTFRRHENEGIPFPYHGQQTSLPLDLANSLTESLLNQPLPNRLPQQTVHGLTGEVKSRKENRLQQLADPLPSALSSTSPIDQESHHMRKVSQQMFMAPDVECPIEYLKSTLPQKPTEQGCNSTPSEERVVSGTSAQNNDSPVTAISGVSTEKALKRPRGYPSASVRAVDDKDQPGKVKPAAAPSLADVTDESRLTKTMKAIH
ncbi:hypothetical protein S40293_01699 [Stachybotrys chartarum IBT 40293]|nr:hypothetical protein S40293_01699 [Stachybotrys chartarum IBT 40293]